MNIIHNNTQVEVRHQTVTVTLVAVVVEIGGGRGHLQRQAVRPLEGVAVPDQEGSWISLLQSCDRCRGTSWNGSFYTLFKHL